MPFKHMLAQALPLPMSLLEPGPCAQQRLGGALVQVMNKGLERTFARSPREAVAGCTMLCKRHMHAIVLD